jgi:hypothetical protein
VQVGVDLPGRAAQIGCSPAAAALPLATINAAKAMMRARIVLVCLAAVRPSSEQAVIHTLS